MAEVTGMTPDRISQEITNATTDLQSHVDSNLLKKADTTYVDSSIFDSIGDPLTAYNKGKGM